MGVGNRETPGERVGQGLSGCEALIACMQEGNPRAMIDFVLINTVVCVQCRYLAHGLPLTEQAMICLIWCFIIYYRATSDLTKSRHWYRADVVWKLEGSLVEKAHRLSVKNTAGIGNNRDVERRDMAVTEVVEDAMDRVSW